MLPRASNGRGNEPWKTVTKKTKLVVAADAHSLSGKARTAHRYGIPIAGKAAFEAMIGA